MTRRSLVLGGMVVSAMQSAPTRRIKLSFPATGESAIAELLDQDAPTVCDFIWNLLPIEHKAIHGMYSGAEVFVLLDKPEPMPRENEIQLPLPGELLYFYNDGSGVTTRKPVSEVCFIYGRGVTLRQAEGVPTYARLFARIPGDWTKDWVDFANACKRVRWEGPQTLRIERVTG
ncbi:MAG: DUF3830 family protein [Bryobacterales bacterium]|nr:DUF3830 family protein [Bryobacterales bacterium]